MPVSTHHNDWYNLCAFSNFGIETCMNEKNEPGQINQNLSYSGISAKVLVSYGAQKLLKQNTKNMTNKQTNKNLKEINGMNIVFVRVSLLKRTSYMKRSKRHIIYLS